jgi:hypothetical protein
MPKSFVAPKQSYPPLPNFIQRVIRYGTYQAFPTFRERRTRQIPHSKCYHTKAVGRVLNSRTRARRQAAKAVLVMKRIQDRLRRENDFKEAMIAIKKLKEWMTIRQYESLYDALVEPWGVPRAFADAHD